MRTIVENGLNEIWGGLLVKPDDEGLRATLTDWNGDIHLGRGLDPGWHEEDGEDKGDLKWLDASPLALELTVRDGDTLHVQQTIDDNNVVESRMWVMGRTA